ncbi:unnamed protein product, partial [Polarella glacialis]
VIMSRRSTSILALPASAYGSPKGKFWQGTKEEERFPPIYSEQEEVFQEYMANQSMSPSRHVQHMAKTSGLLELHYDTMRKRAAERNARPDRMQPPSMNRSFEACAGYSGMIPGKISNNIVGATWMDVSKIAKETRGQHLGSPGSGVTFTLGFKSMSASQSLPSLHGAGQSSPLSRAGSSAMNGGRVASPPHLGDENGLFN